MIVIEVEVILLVSLFTFLLFLVELLDLYFWLNINRHNTIIYLMTMLLEYYNENNGVYFLNPVVLKNRPLHYQN